MSDATPDKPKIIIDDDWKEQVQKEKEEFKSQEQQSGSEQRASGEESIPPPTFSMLVSSLATQSIAALGQIAQSEHEQPVVQLDVAKHFIDLLAMLEEKTKGNLSQQESEMLANVLHELRMLFVAVERQGNPPA